MRKSFLLIPLVMAWLFASCSKGNSSKPSPPQITLVNKWMITADTTFAGDSGKYVETFVLNKKYHPYYQFNSDYSGLRMIDTTGANDKWIFTWNYVDTSKLLGFHYPLQLVDGGDYEAQLVIAQVQLLTATNLKLFISYPSDPAQGYFDNEYIYLTKQN
jgi:hypothetical protein